MSIHVSLSDVSSIFSRTDTMMSSSTVTGPGSISGKAMKRLGEAVLNGVDDILINRELRIESSFRQSSTNGSLGVQAIEEMYQTLFEFTHPGYSNSVRTRALKIVMESIGAMNFQVVAQALVHLDSWSATYRQLSSAIACCWRSGDIWYSDIDYHSAGHDSYTCQQHGGLSHTGPMIIYLTLVALIGSRNHARIILNLVSSASSVVPAAGRSLAQEVFDALLKHVLKARIGLEEEDPLVLHATAVLTSSITEDKLSSCYPRDHLFNILAKVARIMSPAILDPTATNDFAIQSGLPLNPELSMNHGIIASSVGTVPSYLTYDI
ncbi:hypothetical protein PM082_024431 [Marasmius tenuissimus]|nr:hypothetical protein PM082_024431 [Marasmius tenuissimus]